MTKQQRRTETATKLAAQAHVLKRLGVSSLDPKDLANLLEDAAKQLDPMVGVASQTLNSLQAK